MKDITAPAITPQAFYFVSGEGRNATPTVQRLFPEIEALRIT